MRIYAYIQMQRKANFCVAVEILKCFLLDEDNYAKLLSVIIF